MSKSPTDVVREHFAATNRGDFPRAMEFYSEDVVLVVPKDRGLPDPGTYEGREAVGRWFGDWFRSFARGYHFEIEEPRELGSTVMLTAKHGGRGRLSGVEVHGEHAYLYNVRDGRIARVAFFGDRPEALEAAALPEWSQSKTD